jgi:hypothetical protein
MVTATGEHTALGPAEQRALLRIERALGKDKDPDLACALRAFGATRSCFDVDPASEFVSPWHPFLWRAVPVALVIFTVTVIALITSAAVGLL